MPCLTRDVDLSLFTGFGDEDEYARTLLTAFANRPQDWVDIRGVAQRQARLDWPPILTRLAPLVELKGEPEITSLLDRIRHAVR